MIPGRNKVLIKQTNEVHTKTKFDLNNSLWMIWNLMSVPEQGLHKEPKPGPVVEREAISSKYFNQGHPHLKLDDLIDLLPHLMSAS